MKRVIIGLALAVVSASGCGDAIIECTDEFGTCGDAVDPDVQVPKEGSKTSKYGFSSLDPDEPEKGTTSMLLGLGTRGVLHFQDGTCTEPDCGVQPDHCSYFGLICDNRWHIQARSLDLNGEAKFMAELTGACADANNAWEPCIAPKIGTTSASRTFKWKLDMASCPQEQAYSAQRTAMINGWASVRDQTSKTTGTPVIGIGINWVETTGNDWQYYIKCQRWAGDNVQGEYYPADSLTTLKYGIAIAGGQNNWQDTCTTSGTPGYSPTNPNVGTQRQDFVYEVDRHIIAVDMVEMAASANQCTTDATKRMYSYHNVLLHELGHSLGLVHDQIASIDFQAMRASSSCAEMTNRKFAYHPFYREALRSLDTTTSSDALMVWDDDISCFIPDEY